MGRMGASADPMDATTSARRCRAHSKRSGERCRRLAIPGGIVCVMQGGAAPQVAEAARRRLQDGAQRQLLPIMAPDFDVSRLTELGHDVDVGQALQRLRRARARQPRWWKAVNAREDTAAARSMLRAVADLIDPPDTDA